MGKVLQFPKPRSETPYEMRAAGKSGEVYLYDVIGDTFDGTTGKKFAEDLRALGDVATLNVFINSPGGSVFDGVAIYNVLRRHRARKVVKIDGIAASIASLIAMAGDEIQIAANGMMMIHNPWSVSVGDAAQMRKDADTLDRIRDSMLSSYTSRTGIEEDKLVAMLNEETWLSAPDAIELGFADSIVDEVAVAALAQNLEHLKNPPDALTHLVAAAATDEPQGPPDEAAKGEAVEETELPQRHPAVIAANVRLLKRKLKHA